MKLECLFLIVSMEARRRHESQCRRNSKRVGELKKGVGFTRRTRNAETSRDVDISFQCPRQQPVADSKRKGERCAVTAKVKGQAKWNHLQELLSANAKIGTLVRKLEMCTALLRTQCLREERRFHN